MREPPEARAVTYREIWAFPAFPPYTGRRFIGAPAMTKPSSLLVVDSDLHGLETLTYGFEREGCKVTRTSDLSRAVQLSRTGAAPGLAVVMLREPAQPALEVIAALHGAHHNMPILALGDAALQTQARAAGAADF